MQRRAKLHNCVECAEAKKQLCKYFQVHNFAHILCNFRTSNVCEIYCHVQNFAVKILCERLLCTILHCRFCAQSNNSLRKFTVHNFALTIFCTI